MKKKLVSLSIFALTLQNSISQTSINIVGETTNVSGTVITKDITPDDQTLINTGWVEEYFDMHNNTGANQVWRITRKIIFAPSDWTDAVCWGTNCNDATGNLWVSPNTIQNPAPTIANNSSGQMILHITPNTTTSGAGQYRYYITNGGNYLDSVDVLVNFSVGIKDVNSDNSFSIHPNPASDYIFLETKHQENSFVKITDLLGNIVYSNEIIDFQKIDVTNFNDGMYLIQTISSGEITHNEKLLIKH